MIRNYLRKILHALRTPRILIVSSLLIIGAVLLLFYKSDKIVVQAANGKLYNNYDTIPYNKAGILLGTAKYLSGGAINPYYEYRIRAAIDLLSADKILYIIVSGDNGRVNYNEPEQMRSDLIKAGIDSSRIYLDYAGFRTFDSMIRLREIFKQNKVTVISQPFHNERAIYIASRMGIDAIGFNAQDVEESLGYRVQLREKLARVNAVLDFMIGTQPKFLGKPVIVP